MCKANVSVGTKLKDRKMILSRSERHHKQG